MIEKMVMANTSYVPQISILVVDDDPICLAIVRGILQQLKHHVVAVNNPIEALSILRMKEKSFDLVLTDVHMPQMNGLELLKHIDEEFKLPVVLMSADIDKEIMMKGLEDGASFFLLKPISKYNISRIWQHGVSSTECITDNPLPSVDFDLTQLITANSFQGQQEMMMQDSDDNNENYDVVKEFVSLLNEENNAIFLNQNALKSSNSSGLGVKKKALNKKPKLVWTTSLHNIFLDAVNKVGLDKAVPKKILELMNIPGLKRENVASHLQKYRLFLKRIEETKFSLENGIPNDWNERPLRSSFVMNEITFLTNTLQQQYQQVLEQTRARYGEARVMPELGQSSNQVQIKFGDNNPIIMNFPILPMNAHFVVPSDQIGVAPNQNAVQHVQFPVFGGFQQEFPSIVEQQQQQQPISGDDGRLSNNNPRVMGGSSYNNNYVGLRISANGELVGTLKNTPTTMVHGDQAIHDISGFKEKRVDAQQVVDNYHHEMNDNFIYDDNSNNYNSFENDNTNNNDAPLLDDLLFGINNNEVDNNIYINPNNGVVDHNANTLQQDSFGMSHEMPSMVNMEDELKQLGIDLHNNDQETFGNDFAFESYDVQGSDTEGNLFEGLLNQGVTVNYDTVNDDISFESYFAQEYGEEFN